MNIWSTEIKDLKKLQSSFKGHHPKLEKELDRLITTDDENMALVYARRCLEVIITHLCDCELKRSRGTEPLKWIIDKLNKEEKVPHNIIVSMLNLNSLSAFGAHPKEFDPRQVKPVLLDLTTVIEWYLKYTDTQAIGGVKPETVAHERKESVGIRKEPSKAKNRIVMVSGFLLVCAVVIVVLAVFDIIGDGNQEQDRPIESIAVLPFINFTDVDSSESTFYGMHSDLATIMGRISGLRGPPATTSRRYKDAEMSIPEIASELNVDAVIETEVIRISDSIHIRVKLISAFPEEKQIWDGYFYEEKVKYGIYIIE